MALRIRIDDMPDKVLFVTAVFYDMIDNNNAIPHTNDVYLAIQDIIKSRRNTYINHRGEVIQVFHDIDQLFVTNTIDREIQQI